MSAQAFSQVEQLPPQLLIGANGRRASPAITSRLLARYATQTLIEEAELTPKPALVDKRGSGAHDDLSLSLMVRSAQLLEPYFVQMAEAAFGAVASSELRRHLGQLGREAERALLIATNGVNTHRGAIWAMGLLVAAASQEQNKNVQAICRRAGVLARIPDDYAGGMTTHGSRVTLKYGVGGARVEAQSGFPHILEAGLPALWNSRRVGASEVHARLDALLATMATLGDTCLLHRGGPGALNVAQAGAAHVLALGGCSTVAGYQALQHLHEALMKLWASPGGSADLLAATLFLDRLSSSHGWYA